MSIAVAVSRPYDEQSTIGRVLRAS